MVHWVFFDVECSHPIPLLQGMPTNNAKHIKCNHLNWFSRVLQKLIIISLMDSKKSQNQKAETETTMEMLGRDKYYH